MRAVIDTSVWISALLTPRGEPARVLWALQRERFKLVISEPLVAELVRVTRSPRLVHRYGLRADQAARLLALVKTAGEPAVFTGAVRLCRDPKDDMVIETALNGQADALVTRDDDLKGESELVTALQERGVAVLTVRRFLELLDAESPVGSR